MNSRHETSSRSRTWSRACGALATVATTLTLAPGAAAATATATVAVGGGYAFAAANSAGPAHWDTCTAIRYHVNPAGMPDGALPDVQKAVAILAGASGLRLTYAGTTGVVPLRPGWTAGLPTSMRSDLFFAWSTESQHPALAGSVAGLGGTAWTTPAGREPRVVLGGVVLDRASRLPAGFAPGVSRGTLLLHELGHAVNLSHVPDPAQTMYPQITSASLGDYRTGDRAGLAALARRACF